MKPGNPSGESFNSSNYQLPQQDWVCGHHCDGRPCAIGPNGNGECTVTQICTPVLDGSGWHCTRPKAWGGKCKEGPLPDPACPDQAASCPHQPAVCQPQRTLRNRRNLITGITSALALGCCLVILGGSSGGAKGTIFDTSSIVSPGELSAHHGTMEQGCAACHSAATASPTSLLSCAFGSKSSLDDSRKCLQCHQEFGEHALYPHSINPEWTSEKQLAIAAADQSNQHTTQQMLARLLNTHPVAETGELACSSCHIEHRGAAFNLKELTNAQCQSCHSSTFHSFADGHPEFPERKRAFLHFDHSAHLQVHFISAKGTGGTNEQPLSCSDCHVQDATGNSMVLARFESMCAQCHSNQIADDRMPVPIRMTGTEFYRFDIQQPMKLTPFMELMLPSKNTTDNVSADIPELTSSLVTQRENFVAQKLGLSPDAPLDDSPAASAARRLNESGFFMALQQVMQTQSGKEPESEEKPQSEGSKPPVINGAWSLSDDGQALLYRSTGHADPFLRDWLNLAAEGIKTYPKPPEKDPTGVFDRLFRQLAAPEAAGHCMKCHTVDALPDGRNRINWNSRQVISSADGFTKFAHGPHVTLLGSSEQTEATDSRDIPDIPDIPDSPDKHCERWHAVRELEPALLKSEFLLDDWMPNPDFNHSNTLGLTAVTRQSCVECHTASQAGDSCLQCHNYHVHPTKLGER